MIKALCIILQKESCIKFPEAKYTAVAGFFFLRFLIPLLVSPETNGIINCKDQVLFVTTDSLSASSKRTVMLVAKILQNVANGQEFKEEQMSVLNPFVLENVDNVKTFFDSLVSHLVSSPHSKTCEEMRVPPKPAVGSLLDTVEPSLFHILYMQLNLHLSKIGKKIDELKEWRQITLDSSPFEKLLAAMSTIGPPMRISEVQSLIH